MGGICIFRPGVLDEDEQPNEVNKIRSLANDLQSQLEVSCKKQMFEQRIIHTMVIKFYIFRRILRIHSLS